MGLSEGRGLRPVDSMSDGGPARHDAGEHRSIRPNGCLSSPGSSRASPRVRRRPCRPARSPDRGRSRWRSRRGRGLGVPGLQRRPCPPGSPADQDGGRPAARGASSALSSAAARRTAHGRRAGDAPSPIIDAPSQRNGWRRSGQRRRGVVPNFDLFSMRVGWGPPHRSGRRRVSGSSAAVGGEAEPVTATSATGAAGRGGVALDAGVFAAVCRRRIGRRSVPVPVAVSPVAISVTGRLVPSDSLKLALKMMFASSSACSRISSAAA